MAIEPPGRGSCTCLVQRVTWPESSADATRREQTTISRRVVLQRLDLAGAAVEVAPLHDRCLGCQPPRGALAMGS